MRNCILVVIGRSGAGKSTLANGLASEIGAEKLGFSYAGKELAKTKQKNNDFLQLEDYIFYCIMNALNHSKILVLDGLASENIYSQLISKGFFVNTIFLDVPEETRVRRIAKRECCSYAEALVIEKVKAKGKNNSGLDYIISKADFTINGLNKPAWVLNQALQYYKSFVCKEELFKENDSIND